MELFSIFQADGNVVRFFGNIRSFQAVFWASAIILVLFTTMRKKIFGLFEKLLKSRKTEMLNIFVVALFCIIMFIFGKHVINAWNFNHVPRAGWHTGMFNNEPWGFYPWKILELSPMYVFSYLALMVFAFDKKNHREYLILFMFIAILLTFWIAWGAYQCRYIVAPAVALMLLSAKAQLYILNRLRDIPSKGMSILMQGVFILVVIYAAIKTLRVDFLLAVPNNVCYF
jgi:hypothetical protein